LRIVSARLHENLDPLRFQADVISRRTFDTETGEITDKTLRHEGNAVREFYTALEGPVVVGIEATGSMQWFLELLEELGFGGRTGEPNILTILGPEGFKRWAHGGLPFIQQSRSKDSTAIPE
jgi:hypothetical protein